VTKKKNTKVNQSIASNVNKGTDYLIARTAPLAAKVVKEKIEEVILEVRYYPHFEGKTTKRKDSSAPNPVVGARRDIVDSGDLYGSVDVIKKGKGKNTTYEFVLDVPYADQIEDQFNLSETVRSELSL
jgi:hypothetical protein